MPVFNTKVPDYKPSKDLVLEWNSFNKGLNLLLRENEIDKSELAQADNIMLMGKGIPTKRWGMDEYYTAGATAAVRGLKGFYASGVSGVNELLAVTDDGYLTIKDDTSYTVRTGASFASGYHAEMTQLANNMYIVNGQRELVEYNGSTLTGFPTIAVPTGLGLSNISGASGTSKYSYKVSAVSSTGETLTCDAVEISSQPGSLTDGTLRVAWTAVSTASGVLKGYNIYGREQGDERFLAGVGGEETVWLDDGSIDPAEYGDPPLADSTGGPLCRQMTRHMDRLIFAGFNDEPSKVLIGGHYPMHTRFDQAHGGNFILIEPDAGDNTTQVISLKDRTIVFKERSIWQITLSSAQSGNFYITIPTTTLITASHGCIAPRSVCAVENDIFFLSRKGVYALGYEAGYAFDTLRTNEISVKVRPFLKSLTHSQLKNACAAYYDNKYILAFPGLNQCIVFDRERLAWLGPWTFDANIFETYYDSDSVEHLLIGSDNDSTVYDMSENYSDDNGTAIKTNLKTKKEDFKDWTLFKNIKNVFTSFRNITGNVSMDIRLEERGGSVVTAKSFTINPNIGNSGWGADIWGDTLFGDSEEEGGGADITDTIRWANLNKTARTLQFVITTTNRSDDYELLGIRAEARPIGGGIRPSRWRI